MLELQEFRKQIQEWILTHPQEATRLLREAMREQDLSNINICREAQWASRWARKIWAAAGVDPPRR
jgi:uncharacterized membrane protein